MIFNLSGGGAGLNFKIVGGTTQPTSPSANLIWVNTDAEITSWLFSFTVPTEVVEGMVWIELGKSSDINFNALKKNGIVLCPVGAMQYVNGEWIERTAQSYQNDAWIDWFSGVFLFDEGDLCEDVTGGWERTLGLNINMAASTGVYEIGSTLYVSTKDSSGITNRHCALTTVNSVDVTNYNTLVIVVTEASGLVSSATYNCFGLSANKEAHTAKAVITGTGEFTMDISSLSGSYYPFINVSNDDRYIRVSRMWLE